VRARWQRFTRLISRIVALLLAFAVARVAVGIVIIATDSDATAWGLRATLITAIVVVFGLAIGALVARLARAAAN
jgi:hypothetical protein